MRLSWIRSLGVSRRGTRQPAKYCRDAYYLYPALVCVWVGAHCSMSAWLVSTWPGHGGARGAGGLRDRPWPWLSRHPGYRSHAPAQIDFRLRYSFHLVHDANSDRKYVCTFFFIRLKCHVRVRSSLFIRLPHCVGVHVKWSILWRFRGIFFLFFFNTIKNAYYSIQT